MGRGQEPQERTLKDPFDLAFGQPRHAGAAPSAAEPTSTYETLKEVVEHRINLNKSIVNESPSRIVNLRSLAWGALNSLWNGSASMIATLWTTSIKCSGAMAAPASASLSLVVQAPFFVVVFFVDHASAKPDNHRITTNSAGRHGT